MARLAIGVEYVGSAYCGWQWQPSARSIQSVLQEALARVADAPVALICAGRTDAGVHARAQVAHFEAERSRTPRAWMLGANNYLPGDIAVRWVQPVAAHFHARYSALTRTYRYLILNRPARSAHLAGRALCVHRPLAQAPMQAAATLLLGEHDFSAFRAAECQARSPIRRLDSIHVIRSGEWLSVEITANAFLHHMVRNIVGLLLSVGRGDAPPERALEQLQSRCRSLGEATAAAEGLYLWRVQYPSAFGLPADSAMIWPAL